MSAEHLFDMGDTDRFDSLVRGLALLVGEAWIDEVRRLPDLRALGAKAGDCQEGTNFLRALRAHASGADDPQAVQDRADPQLRLNLGCIALLVDQVQAIEGGARIRAQLGDLAVAWQFDRFFDRLFEAEAALHWSRSSGVTRIVFPVEAHPDFWSDLAVAGRTFPYPHECKRIQSEDPHGRALNTLAESVEHRVRELWSTIGALKLTVWLHVPAEQIRADALLTDLAHLAAQAQADGSTAWHTRSDANGSYQVSLARAPEWGDFASRTIELPDIPACPVLRVCTETKYRATALDPVRLKYVVSVRSDVLPRRIGAFERNLTKALRQLPKSAAGVPGIVNVRLRPPRDLGDLYEADAIVRRVLESDAGHDLALVCLFWNESEREEGPWRATGELPERDVTALWHLRVHYVSASRVPIDFSPIDSGANRFPPIDGVLMRDPSSGTLVPVPQDVVALLDDPASIDTLLVPASEARQNAATLYFKLEQPYCKDITQVARVFTVADRVFLATFAGDWCFRVIEFANREPVRVATIDLRAWLGQSEFLITLRDANRDWSLTSGFADGVREARVKSAAIPRAFL
jgi:hypothetical protein